MPSVDRGVFLKANKKPVINQPAKFLIEGC